MRTVLALSMLALPVLAQTEASPRPKVEVVFVLDTTGSMSGLIQAAKQKIWAIANEIARAKPDTSLFDQEVTRMIRDQAAKKGFRFE